MPQVDHVNHPVDVQQLAHHIRSNPAFEAYFEERLLTVVANASATYEGRQMACELLRRVATDDSVPTLAALLDDPVIANDVRFALQDIGTPRARQAFWRWSR